MTARRSASRRRRSMQRRAASSVLICSRPSLFDKYGMHRPLTRQSTRFKCEGLELSTSTLADRVGYGTAALLPRAAPKIPPPCSDGYLPWHWSPRPLPAPRLSQPDGHRHQRLHHQRWGRMLSEDLEFLEAFVRNSNNRANGSIISVVTSADDHRTTAHGIDELSDILSNARRSLKPGSTFFTASQMAKNSSRA